MRFFFLIISVCISLFVFLENGYAACTIEQGPPQKMLEYFTQVRTELSRIRSQAGGANQCNGRQGTFSSERRAAESLKRVDEVFTGWGTSVTNFFYNIPFTAEGGSRGPVTNHGKLWRDIETEATRTLQSVASMCALDVSIASGGTPKDRIVRIIEKNRTIEAYYWQVALGQSSYAEVPGDMDAYSGVLEAIRDNYNYEATRSCKGPEIVDNIEARLKEFMSSAGKFGKGNEQSTQNWKDAIALFSGGNTSKEKYIDVERRVLAAELSRQGLTTNAKKAILGRLDCLAGRTDQESSPETRSKEQKNCEYNLIAGTDNVTRILRFFIPSAKTTTEYLARTLKYDAEKYRLSNDVAGVWQTLIDETKVTDEPTNEKIINDLITTHYKIVTINTPLKDAIKRMYDNCKKGQPDVECPRP